MIPAAPALAERCVRGVEAAARLMSEADRRDLALAIHLLRERRLSINQANAAFETRAKRRQGGVEASLLEILEQIRVVDAPEIPGLLAAENQLPLSEASLPESLAVVYLPSRGELRFRSAGEAQSIGPYEVVEEIGRGGMGIVYRVYRPETDECFALKRIHVGRGVTERDVGRFRREIQVLGELDHPGIVRIHDHGFVDDALYLVMELVPGETLDLVIDRGSFPVPEGVRIAIRLTEALEYAHGRGIVHRDLKSSNVILDPEGEPHLLDFGLARRIDATTQVTLTGDMVGTPGYIAPEAIDASIGKIGPETDVYSLGVMLYEMATLTLPFEGPDLSSFLARALVEVPRNPRSLRPEIPALLAEIILRCLEKDPARRYRSMAALRSDLLRVGAGDTPRARLRLAAYLARRWTSRRRRVAAIALGMAALALFGAYETYRAVDAESEGRAAGEGEERARWVESQRLVGAAEERMEAALAWRRAGDPGRIAADAEAIGGILDRALETYPDFPTALVARARLARLLGEDAEAFRLLDRAIELEPGPGIAYYERGLLQADRFQRLLEERIEVAERRRVLELGLVPDGAPRRRGESLGSILATSDPRIEEARAAIARDFERIGSLELFPDREAAGKGLVALHRGDLEGARAWLETAVDRNPLLVEAWLALGFLHAGSGNAQRAADAYGRAVEADRGLWIGRLERARALDELAGSRDEAVREDLYAEASRELATALELSRATPALAGRAASLVGRAQVILALTRAIQADSRGDSPALEKHAALALEACQRICALSSGDPSGTILHGHVLVCVSGLATARGPRAALLLRTALDVFRVGVDADAGSAEALAGLGVVTLRQADLARAEDAPSEEEIEHASHCLDRAIALEPEASHLYENRAAILAHLARRSGSPDALELARADLAKAIELAGVSDGSVEVFRRLVAASPDPSSWEPDLARLEAGVPALSPWNRRYLRQVREAIDAAGREAAAPWIAALFEAQRLEWAGRRDEAIAAFRAGLESSGSAGQLPADPLARSLRHTAHYELARLLEPLEEKLGHLRQAESIEPIDRAVLRSDPELRGLADDFEREPR